MTTTGEDLRTLYLTAEGEGIPYSEVRTQDGDHARLVFINDKHDSAAIAIRIDNADGSWLIEPIGSVRLTDDGLSFETA